MRHGFAVSVLILLASCVAPSAPPPAPPPLPSPRPAPPPPPPVASEWQYAPLTPGTWSYRDGTASYGLTGSEPLFVLRCVETSRAIVLGWPGAMPAGGNRATITTTYGRQPLNGAAANGLAAGYTGVSIPASSGLLDQMAFSRGRLMIEYGPGQSALILPAWPEISRAIEDCRK